MEKKISNIEETVIRTTPLIIIQRIFFIELAIILITMPLSFIADYIKLFNNFTLISILSYNLLSSVILSIFQIIIISIAILSWYSELYKIKKNKITYRRNKLFKEKDVVCLKDIKSVECFQKKFRSIVNYGAIKIKLNKNNKKITLRNIPSPCFYTKVIKQKIEELKKDKKPIEALIKQKENKHLEFKSSFMWDYKEQKMNKDLKKAVMKNIAAFMNTNGGIIIIGIDDSRKVLGLAPDFQLINKNDSDGFENVFNMSIAKMLGIEFREYIDIVFEEIDEKTICAVYIQPSLQPVYLTYKDNEAFYIRTGNSSQPLSVKKATEYINTHFKQKKKK